MHSEVLGHSPPVFVSIKTKADFIFRSVLKIKYQRPSCWALQCVGREQPPSELYWSHWRPPFCVQLLHSSSKPHLILHLLQQGPISTARGNSPPSHLSHLLLFPSFLISTCSHQCFSILHKTAPEASGFALSWEGRRLIQHIIYRKKQKCDGPRSYLPNPPCTMEGRNSAACRLQAGY